MAQGLLHVQLGPLGGHQPYCWQNGRATSSFLAPHSPVHNLKM